jgi:hypothetical protein
VYSLTQDQRAIVLDNTVAFYPEGGSKAPVYQNTVRVVSQPRTEEDLAAYWSGEDGEKLKAEASALLAESLRIALAETRRGEADAALVQKTFRYPEGSSERIERAGMVSESCDRLVLKTLRGWMLSVPKRAAAADCAPPTKTAAQ